MNYLKVGLLTLISVVSIKSVSAQKFYIGISSGYAIGVSNQRGDLVNSYIDYSKSVTVYEFENVPYSLGKGWNVGGQFGYRFNENIGFEMQMTYHQSADVFQEDITITSLYGVGKDKHIEDKVIKSKMYRIVPSFILQTNNKKINPYMKLGVVIGFGSIITNGTSSYISSANMFESTNKKIDKGGSALGGKGTLGVDYMISSKWSIFSELSFMTLSYAPEYGNIETSDGTKKNYNYDDSFSERDRHIILFDQPETLKTSYNFNSCGLDFGMKFHF